LAFVDPAVAIIISLGFLVALLYKRVNLGIVLNATALLLALLAVNLSDIPRMVYAATVNPEYLPVVLATFGIMLLSQLYRETGFITKLSNSIGKILHNPKAVLSVVPAVIGLLPVAGGALMSAPVVDAEADKLKLKPDRKAYVNLWFRHTIFPVYALSPPVIVTASLTGVAVSTLIVRQIPVVAVMVAVGFVIGFWKTQNPKNTSPSRTDSKSNLKTLATTFAPILVTIIVTVTLDAANISLFSKAFNIVLAIVVGLAIFLALTRPSTKVLTSPLKSWGIYGITLAAYGAFLLRDVMVAAGISDIFRPIVANGSLDAVILLTLVPAALGLLTGSPAGGVAIAVSVLAGSVTFSPAVAGLIYISAYLGYTVAPTHLCFTFTADYFKCSLGRIYKYVIPSFLASFAAAVLVYYLI